MNWRIEPALYLHPSGNAHDGAYFMKISNGERAHRNKATVVPMPEDVVEKYTNLLNNKSL